MDFDSRAREIIAHAEKSLAALAAEAASHLDYPAAGMLLGLAQRIAGSIPSAPAGSQELSDGAEASASNGETAPKRLLRSAATKTAPQYPRFKREDDTLIKVGWSKSDRSTYEHKSPRSVLERLVVKISEAGASGQRFTTEEILPLLDDRGDEMPSYQAYLCLAWLVTANLLERHGRQGYTIVVPGNFREMVESQWQQLPRR